MATLWSKFCRFLGSYVTCMPSPMYRPLIIYLCTVVCSIKNIYPLKQGYVSIISWMEISFFSQSILLDRVVSSSCWTTWAGGGVLAWISLASVQTFSLYTSISTSSVVVLVVYCRCWTLACARTSFGAVTRLLSLLLFLYLWVNWALKVFYKTNIQSQAFQKICPK